MFCDVIYIYIYCFIPFGSIEILLVVLLGLAATLSEPLL